MKRIKPMAVRTRSIHDDFISRLTKIKIAKTVGIPTVLIVTGLVMSNGIPENKYKKSPQTQIIQEKHQSPKYLPLNFDFEIALGFKPYQSLPTYDLKSETDLEKTINLSTIQLPLEANSLNFRGYSISGLVLPKFVLGEADLSNCNLQGTVLPLRVGENLDLRGSYMSDDIKLPMVVEGITFFDEGVWPPTMDLPETVGEARRILKNNAQNINENTPSL